MIPLRLILSPKSSSSEVIMNRINLNVALGQPLWIYGFPTVGKTHFQRTLRFLNGAQRKMLGLPTVVDATDTDDWLGVFKMSECNEEQRKMVRDACRSNILLANSIPSNHPRVIVTNLWDRLAECDIAPSLICVPSSVDVVRSRVQSRGDVNPEWITEQSSKWLSHVKGSPWFNKHKDVVVEVDADTYLADCVTINEHPFPFTFDREGCVKNIEDVDKVPML